MMQKSSLSNFCLTNVRNLKVFLEVHGRDIDFAKSEQSYHWLARMQMQLQLDCSCHFTGRDIYQSHTPLYAYMWNGIKPIFNQVFDPMTLTCCFCFWRMLRIQVWLSQVVWRWHWPHIQRKLSLLMAKEEDHTKCMFVTINNFKK